MERIVSEQIKCYFSLNTLTTDFQHAYREGHSTATALTQMTDDWLREIDKKKMVGAVLLDFTAAFDIIDHKFLLKLECYGFFLSALSWIQTYLANRKQIVFFLCRKVRCGVPQGSCLGPLRYTIFTNDMPLVLNESYISMYADDSTIYTSASTANELNTVLNSELQSVVEWIKNNKLVLNISKTNSHALSKNPVLKLLISDKVIDQVQETELLGVTLDSKLSWSQHINKLVVKMGRGISVVKRCAHLLPLSTVKQVTQALILSNLDYCPVVWSNVTKNKLKKLQIVQNKAARIVLRCEYRSDAQLFTLVT